VKDVIKDLSGLGVHVQSADEPFESVQQNPASANVVIAYSLIF